MYRLLRFIIFGTWQLPPEKQKHIHRWQILRQGQNNYGPVITLRCQGCGDCKIVRN